MGKITFPVRTFLIVLFLLGSSLTFLTAKNKSVAPVVTGAITPVSCFNGNNGSIDVTVSGAVGNYSVSWTGINSTSEDVANLIAGNFTITVTDSENNSSSETFQVEQPTELILQAGSSSPVSCNGGSDGIITASNVSGGNGSYQYSINGTTFQNSNTFSGLTANTYNLTVRDSKNCTVSQAVEVTQPDVITMAAPTSSPVSCNGGNDGIITAGSVSGGNGSYQYSINGTTFQNSNTFSGLKANTYNLTVKDSKNCTVTQTIEVNQPDVLTMAAPTSSPVSCNGGNDGSLTAGNVSSGNGSYQYSINGTTFQNSNIFSGLMASTYILTVKDSKNCSLSQSIELTQPDVLTMAVPTSSPVSCNGGSDGIITAGNVSGGNGSYQYSINGTTFQNSNTFSGLTANTYNFTVRDSKNCTTTQAIEITQPEILSASVSSENISCYGTSDGSISITNPQGGYGTYQYSVNGGSNWQDSGNFTGLPKGNYTVLIRDKAKPNCTATLNTLEITEPLALFAEFSFSNNSCNSLNDGSIKVTNFSGGYGTYEFSNNNGTSWQASNEFQDLSNGFYTVLVRDKENTNCVLNVVSNLEIIKPAPLNGDIDTIDISCNGLTDGTIIISNPSGGYNNFEYSLDSFTWQSDHEFKNLGTGTYSVYIRDADKPSCFVRLFSTTEIDEPEILTSTITSSDVLCNGLATGEVTATAMGGTAPYTFSWGSLGAGATKTNLTAGTYAVTVTDANGCSTAPREVVITEPDTFIEITNVTTTSGCFQQNNGTATVDGTGGTGAFTYLWSNGQTSPQATGLAPGNHTVTITDENGCTKTRTVTVSTPTQLQITGFLTTETTSFGSATGTATVQVGGGSGGYTFLWSNGQTGQTATSLPAGTYTVTVTDSNGCNITADIVVVDSIEAEIVPTSVCEGSGEIIRTSYFKADETTLRGGTPPYTFEWEFEGDGSISEATGIGPHRVTYQTLGQKQTTMIVRDINGLEFQQTIIQYVGGCFSDDCGSSDLGIEDYYVGDGDGNPITSSDCSNSDSKFIYIYIPTNPNRYSLNVELIYSIENIETGEVKNLKEVGCFYEQEAIPDRAKTFQIEFSCANIVKIEGIYLTFSNRKRDNCGEGNQPKCYSTNNEATVDSPLFAGAFPNELLCNGSSSGRISVRASGGTPLYQYKLVNALNGEVVRVTQPGEIFENLEAGIYDVLVSDSDNPINTYTVEDVEITEPTNPLLFEDPTITNITCFGGEDGAATVRVSGGTPNTSEDKYIYVWSNGQIGPTATNLSAGEYTVTVTDANGCQIDTIVSITQPEQLLAVAGPDQVLTCGTTSTTLNAEFNYEFPEGEEEKFGQWTIINGPAGGNFTDDTDPKTVFTGTQGTYTLRWSVPCGASDDVKISLSNCNTIDFDGNDDHIVFGDNFNLPGAFTIEAWIKQDPTKTSGIKTIFSKRDLSNLSAGYDLIIENNIPKFRWNNSTLSSQYPIGTDRWYHIAVIKGGSNDGLYVDGILVSDSQNGPGTPTALAQPFLIGATHDATTPNIPKNYFHGWIEEVRIWNTALKTEQLHFMMNQRLKDNAGKVRGVEIPMNTPGNLDWNSLIGYYQLEFSENGLTPGKIQGSPSGKLINITTTQQRTAPLPYISSRPGQWYTDATWLRPQVWDPPASIGVDGTTIINWNIAKTAHNINSGGKNIQLLGLLTNSGKLTIANPNEALNEKNYGQSLTITHYLKLNGIIDLVGESQLVQTDIGDIETNQTITSVLEESSTGYIERDQQGTANSYNYNYWSSPVSIQKAANNSTYTVASIMMDGSPTLNNGKTLSFNDWHEHADYSYPASAPRKVSNYWINKFRGTANVYSEWKQIGSSGVLNAGEGYTMKGTSGQAAIADRQNYIFKGKPNNGTIPLNIQKNQNYLLGNPYPSAIDVNKFILDNLKTANGGTNTQNIFNGAVYFWDHFAGGDTHILLEYIGGYATRNLLDGVPAIANDDRIDNSDTFENRNDKKIPGQFIPVAQGFFINSVIDTEIAGDISVDGGDVLFKNSQRVFMRESSGNTGNSVFLRPEEHTKQEAEVDKRPKIRLDFKSPMGYYRQILVGVDENASNGFDLGYDALMNDYNLEDMYWIIGGREFVIQGVSNFGLDQKFPLGLRINEEGEVMVKINELKNIGEEINIFLKDKSNDTYYDLRESEAKLNLSKGEITDRFEIVFQKDKEAPDPDETTDPEETPGEEPDPNEGTNPDPNENPDNILPPGTIDVIFAEDDHQLRILNPDELNIQLVEIFNLVGQKIEIFQTDSNLKQLNFQVQEHQSALYVVKVFAEEGMVSKNILIMK